MKGGKKASSRRSRDAKWEWRKNYRIWEANRKIFLYPENWVEPDLRPPDACLVSLREVVTAVRAQSGARAKRTRNAKLARAKGVRVLFTGKNRAGGLVAAEILASALRINLYDIDLSAVANKYIGETEKNLKRVFDAAEQGGAALLFDEADALFGKRTGVKDSHDRYANIEVNYLLQRIEHYQGLVILTTNSRGRLDAAFLRRFHFIIRVPPPRKGR